MISRRNFVAASAALCAGWTTDCEAAKPETYDKIIDVYDPNKLNLEEAQQQKIGAIIYQVGRGTCYTDSNYKTYRDQAKNRGFLWGAYFMTSLEPNESQLKSLLAVEDCKDQSTLVAIDWETACGGRMKYAQMRDFIKLFVDKVGFFPMIYGGDAIRECKELIAGDKFFANCPVWYLRYRSRPIGLPTKTWPTYTLWQYDDEKRQNGAPKQILEGADWSRFQGTEVQLKAMWPFRRPA